MLSKASWLRRKGISRKRERNEADRDGTALLQAVSDMGDSGDFGGERDPLVESMTPLLPLLLWKRGLGRGGLFLWGAVARDKHLAGDKVCILGTMGRGRPTNSQPRRLRYNAGVSSARSGSVPLPVGW